MTDWRLPEHRRKVFLDSWEFHLMFGTLPGCVHHLLPAIAEHYELDDDGRAWLVWLNANTQNPAMSLLLLEASRGSAAGWQGAVDFWNTNFSKLDWDTDRRHQKGKFGEATQKFIAYGGEGSYNWWAEAGLLGWKTTWAYANNQPYMGRLSAWSMIEYARILFGPDVIPDADDLMLRDADGSRSHRAGLAVVSGYEGAEYWGWPETRPFLPELETLAYGLMLEMTNRCRDKPYQPSRLDLESALCTYKGWHKPNRRYPNVYADMAYLRLRRAEERFGGRFGLLWEARAAALPDWARLECTPGDPGLKPAKQNHYRETGEVIMMGHVWPKYWSSFDEEVHGHG